MITVLSGDNTYEIERQLAALRAAFAGDSELIDGAELTLAALPDLLMGVTLFSHQRQVVIKGLSTNSALWNSFDDWIPRVAADLELILVEPKLDKRTKTYKALKAAADLRELSAWREWDTALAERWLADEAAARDITLDAASRRALVGQVGADQWQLHYALEKLAVLETVTPAVIQAVVEAVPQENVFNLLETALKGDRVTLRRMIATLEQAQEPYMTLGLLTTQAVRLAGIVLADKPLGEVAKDLGAKDVRALTGMQRLAERIGRSGVRRLIAALADADHRLKTSSEDPWLAVETALLQVAGS